MHPTMDHENAKIYITIIEPRVQQEQGAPIETDTERYRRLKSLSERAEDSITHPMTRAAIHVSGAVQVYKHEGKPHARFATAIRTFLERDQQRLAVCHQSQTNVGRFT